MATAKQHRDLHKEITDNIIEAIENGADGTKFSLPWVRLASEGLPENATTHKPYRGVNILNLWITAVKHGFETPYWASYKQWKSVGAQVRHGEKGTPVVFYKKIRVKDEDEDGEEITKTIPLLRYSNVFNADQVDGWEAPERQVVDLGSERIPEIDKLIEETGAEIRYNGGRAYYNRAEDFIGIPERRLFKSTAGFYSTQFHELTHWSGAESRLDRTFGKRFGDQQYAAEELVAELGATFLAAELGLEAEPREDHAQYVANWLQLLREDDKAIFTAAARASDAVDFLTGRTTAPEKDEESKEEERAAIVTLREGEDPDEKLREVRAYLPDNYRADLLAGSPETDVRIRIKGRDVAGWTLDEYVIPRLASGTIFATEETEEVAA